MILAYHRINPWYENDPLSVSPLNFEKQIKYLINKGFKNVSIDEYEESRKDFVITFDDGFYDILFFGFPVFKNLNLKVIIFVVVDFISTERVWERYKDYERDRFLKWEEVIYMAEEGIEFGSHTLTHPHLTEISEEKAKEEIFISKKIIEDKIGKEVKFFCYPYGEFNEKIIEMVKMAGYKGAVVTPKKFSNFKSHPFNLRRVGIYGHNNFFTFKFKIWKEYIRERF